MLSARKFICNLTLFVGICLSLAVPALAQTGPCATVVPGQTLPDLIVDGNRLKSDLLVSQENFSGTACAVVEGCVSSRGTHLLLRFSSSTPNVGLGDLVIGNPATCTNLFHQSECHNHLHFKEYSDYRLWTLVGYNFWVSSRDLSQPTNTGSNEILLSNAVSNGDLILGRKQGFCIIDIERYTAPPNSAAKYTLCGSSGQTGSQGLSVGWTDIYGQQLDCQYVQIDALKEGTYVLEDQVNPEHLLPESNYSNNSSAVRFNFTTKHGKTPARISNATVLP